MHHLTLETTSVSQERKKYCDLMCLHLCVSTFYRGEMKALVYEMIAQRGELVRVGSLGKLKE